MINVNEIDVSEHEYMEFFEYPLDMIGGATLPDYVKIALNNEMDSFVSGKKIAKNMTKHHYKIDDKKYDLNYVFVYQQIEIGCPIRYGIHLMGVTPIKSGV